MNKIRLLIAISTINFLFANSFENEGNIRGFYLDKPNAKGSALSLKLKTSKDVENISFSSVFYGAFKLSNPNELPSSLLVENRDSYVILGEANIKYIAKYFDIRIGRIKIDTPLIGADDGRAIPNLYEGVYLKSSYLENLSIESLFLNKMSGFWSQIHSQIEMGRFISMGKAAGYEGIADNSKVFALGVTYTKDNLSAKIWNYYSNELLNAYIVEGSITNNLFNSTLTTTLQYVSQEQIGDTKTYLNSLNRTLDYSYFGAKLELNYENLTTLLAMTNMDYQNKNWDNTMHIWAGLPQYTVAQEYGFKSANVNGADVYKAGLSYKFSQKNKIDLNYYKYDLSNKVSSNDTDVIDLIYNLKYSKNIDFTAVYERQEFKSNDSGDIAKVIANYSF